MASLLMVGLLLGLLAHLTLTVAIQLEDPCIPGESGGRSRARQVGLTLVVGYNLVAVALLVWLALPLLMPPVG